MNQQGGVPWHPARDRRRDFLNYSPRQEARWQALDIVNGAMTYGWAAMLRPGPHFSAAAPAYEAWKQKVVEQWATESERDARDLDRSPGLADLPEHLWLWWYEAMLKTKDLPVFTPSAPAY